jgi:hypothetical protein
MTLPDMPDLFAELPILNEIGAEIERILSAEEESPRQSRSDARRTGACWRRARPLVLVFALAIGGTGVAFASGLLSFGEPVKPTPVFSNAQVGLGAVTPGSVSVLAIATPDPQGGPPWGLRVLTTTRDAGCVEVGRLLDGQLVALGQYGAFANDGRAHQVPVSAAVNSFNCTPLDNEGHFVNSITMIGQTASAAWWFRSTQCVPTGTPRSTSRAHPACPLRDERDVYYGLLGPDAKSITYTIAGQRHAQATVGAQGAYLIVTDAAAHQRIPGAGGATDDDVPVYSPITSIEYRGGVTCHLLTGHRWIVGFHACSPSLNVPLGYVRAIAPTQAQVATPIHAQLIRLPAQVVRYHVNPRRGSSATRVIRVPASQEITVSFKSRITLKNLRGQYQIEYHEPGAPAQAESFSMMGAAKVVSAAGDPILGLDGMGSDIAAGQTVTGTITGPLGPLAPAWAKLGPGLLRGNVTLDYSTGPDLDGGFPTKKITVGTFTVEIP